ncbi:MAG: divergent PAP2 family protein [Lachnospiraceae bacterium]|nr:divergent PAP2 family protein [Lachnospiraceae bacterium]
MNGLIEVLQNRILMTGIFSWFTAQILKTIIHMFTNKEFDIRRMVGDGGMPSCHSATVTAVAITTGYECGFSSPLFAIAGILAIIVMHDAMGVRLETGTHAKLLNEMITLFEALGQKQVSVETKLKEFVGHTPMQVLVGFLWGFLVAWAANRWMF